MAVDVKNELVRRAAAQETPVKLTKSMTIVDMVKALEPEIRKALPTVLTPERFTRMAFVSDEREDSVPVNQCETAF